MDKTKLIELALQEWTAKFRASKDKATKGARARFEELFDKWKEIGADFSDVEAYLPKAIKVHQPAPSRARDVYKRLHDKMGRSEKEFIEEWNDAIEAAGTEAFFEFFPPTPVDHDPEPKVYGSMSATEYRAQRRYSEQFPTLDTTELVKAWKEQQEYNLDVNQVLENVLGEDKDETNS